MKCNSHKTCDRETQNLQNDVKFSYVREFKVTLFVTELQGHF